MAENVWRGYGRTGINPGMFLMGDRWKGKAFNGFNNSGTSLSTLWKQNSQTHKKLSNYV